MSDPRLKRTGFASDKDQRDFRYTRFLKKARMIQFSPTTKKGLYAITETGKLFVQGKITTAEEYITASGVHSLCQYQLVVSDE